MTVVSPTQAKVSYAILAGGQPALSGQTGVAIKQDGTWKVGVASFCGVLTVETTAGPRGPRPRAGQRRSPAFPGTASG